MAVDDASWWLPETPDLTVSGRLVGGEHDFLRLDTNGQHLVSWQDTSGVVVWGKTAAGTAVTLLGCGVHWFDHTHQHIHVHVALTGIHIASADDAKFTRAVVGITNLTNWARWGGRMSSLPTHIPNPIRPGETLGLIDTDGEVQLLVESAEPRTWTGFDDTAESIRDLLTVAGNADCRMETMTLSTADGVSVQVRAKADAVIDHRWHPVFDLHAINPHNVIPRWLELRDRIGMSGAVLLSLDYGGPGYFQNKLFNAASAAEGIHQALWPNESGIPAASYKQLTAHLKQLQDPQAKQFALDAVGGNRPSFATRMRQLARHPDPDAVDTVLHDTEQWIKWMRDARNAIGHSAWPGMDKIPHHIRPALTYVTKTLLHLVLLAELGLSGDQQRSAAVVSYSVKREPYDDCMRP